MKRIKIGSYIFELKHDKNEKYSYSAFLYKDDKILTGFKSKEKITEDMLIDFIFDRKCIRNERSITDII